VGVGEPGQEEPPEQTGQHAHRLLCRYCGR
jgi:hypothetical protein